MSVLGDAQELYQSVGSTWRRRRSHILAHAAAAFVVFGLCRATLPDISMPTIDPDKVMAQPWYKLAKDSGLIYLGLFVPFLAAGCYISIIATLGNFLVIALRPLTSNRRLPELPFDYAKIALLLDRNNIKIYNIEAKVGELWSEFRLEKVDIVTSFDEQSFAKITDGRIYMGDLAVFICMWIDIFHYYPNADWVIANRGHYWSVLTWLVVLIVLARAYYRNMVNAYFSLRPFIVTRAMLANDDLRAKSEATVDENERVTKLVDQELKNERTRLDRGLTIVQFIKGRLPMDLFQELMEDVKRSRNTRNYRNYEIEGRIRDGRRVSLKDWLAVYIRFRVRFLWLAVKGLIYSLWRAIINLI